MRGSIERRDDDTARITVSSGFDEATGKRRRLRAVVKREQGQTDAAFMEAIELAQADMIRDLETGTDLEPGKVTVAALFDRWLKHKAARGGGSARRGRQGIGPRTLRRYREMIRHHIVPVIGALNLQKVRPSHIDDVMDRMAEAGLSGKTIKDARLVMSAAFRQARRWRLVGYNPVEDTDAPRVEAAQLEHVPSPEELAALLDGARVERLGAALAVFLATGLRRGELLGLRWRDLELDGRRPRLHVRQTLQRVPRYIAEEDRYETSLEITEPKTDRSRRAIALPAFTLEVLRAHRAAQNKRRLKMEEAWEDHDLVFPAWNGAPRDPDAFGHTMRRLMVAGGLDPRTRLHDLRHGFATALLSEGVHPAIASAVLGHSSPAFTMSTYQHVLDGMTDTAAEAISTALGRKVSPKVSPSAEGEHRS